MTTTPVQLYVIDPAFTNRSVPTPPVFCSAGGIAQLSAQGLSYFQTPYQIRDPRASNTRTLAWAAQTSPALLVDDVIYPDFIAAVTAAPEQAVAGLFGLIDFLAFNYTPGTSVSVIETSILANSNLSPYYQPGSFSIASSTVVGNVYFSNDTTIAYTAPTKINFVINIPSGSQTLSYAITAWLENATFLAGYANSTIVAVVPPTNYTTLLNQSIAATAAAMATLAYAASFTQPLINTAIQTAELSGYTSYTAKIIDGSSFLNMSFGIAYVGQVPTFAAMRAAIQAAVQNSGVGTAAQWKVRIPELYVESRIYLIPMWDQLITSGSGTLYAGIASPIAQLAKATTALGSSPASTLVSQYAEFLTAAYNHLPIVAVPDSTSQPSDNLATLFPTYQSYSSIEANFLYMSADTQTFATSLNTALPVAAGITTNSAYPIIVDGPLTYVSFTQDLVEFCILTRAFYDQQLGVSA